MSAARTVRRPLAFLTRRHAASTADFWRMDVRYSCGVIHGGGGRVQTAVAVALSGAAEALVCRLAAQRRASCAWRAEPRPRARAPRPWPRARARCARAWRSESHRIAEVFDDDFQSLSACAHSPHCHVTLYYAFSDAPSACALTVARHSSQRPAPGLGCPWPCY